MCLSWSTRWTTSQTSILAWLKKPLMWVQQDPEIPFQSLAHPALTTSTPAWKSAHRQISMLSTHLLILVLSVYWIPCLCPSLALMSVRISPSSTTSMVNGLMNMTLSQTVELTKSSHKWEMLMNMSSKMDLQSKKLLSSPSLMQQCVSKLMTRIWLVPNVQSCVLVILWTVW